MSDQRPTANSRRRSGRRWFAAAGVAAAGLLVLGTQTASAGPPKVPPAPCPDTCVVTPTPPGEFLRAFTNDGAFVLGQNTVTKAKLTINIPTTLLHTYSYIDVLQDSTDIFSVDAFVTPQAGSKQPLGSFEPIPVSTLAFGALPVTAVVHLSQPVLKTGYLQPLKIVDSTSIVNSVSVTVPTKVTGLLTLQLTDAKVDGTPLNLGPDCGTAQPVAINLVGKDPEYNGPVVGGILRGNANVGTFAHCGVGGDDLDPLLTKLFSSTKNALIMSQGVLGQWTDPNVCVLQPINPNGCTLPPPLPKPKK